MYFVLNLSSYNHQLQSSWLSKISEAFIRFFYFKTHWIVGLDCLTATISVLTLILEIPSWFHSANIDIFILFLSQHLSILESMFCWFLKQKMTDFLYVANLSEEFHFLLLLNFEQKHENGCYQKFRFWWTKRLYKIIQHDCFSIKTVYKYIETKWFTIFSIS